MAIQSGVASCCVSAGSCTHDLLGTDPRCHRGDGATNGGANCLSVTNAYFSWAGRPEPCRSCGVLTCLLFPATNGKSSGQIFPASGPPFGVSMLLPWVLRCLLSALLWPLPLIAPPRYHRPITSTRVRTAIWCQRSSSTGVALSATCALLVLSPACSAHLTPDNPRSLITSSRHPDRHMVSACFFPGCCIACWLRSSGELSIGAGS